MEIRLTKRPTRKGEKIYYTFEWGKGAGDRRASGIFIYSKPKGPIEKNHNKEALVILETKRSQLILERQATRVMKTITTGRSNNIITIIAVQDYSQLKLVYSREEAEVVFNIAGNVISSQVSGETAKLLSERFAKTFQERESISINSNDTSIIRSKHLDIAVPASTISSLLSGEFVGVVCDDPDQLIEQKTFHAMVINDHDALKTAKAYYQPLPIIHQITEKEILENYLLIKQDVQDIVEQIMEDLLNDPEKENLTVKH